MLKTYPTSTQLPKRVRLVSLVRSIDATTSTSTTTPGTSGNNSAQTAKMTTEAAISARTQQPIFASQRAKLQQQQQHQQQQQDSTDDNQKAQRAMTGLLPLGYKEAAHEWWTGLPPAAAERNVLSLIPYLKDGNGNISSSNGSTEYSQLQQLAQGDPFGHRVWRSTMVPLSGRNRALNEFSVERIGDEHPADETLVMLHGYGAGLGFFYRNFEPLSRAPGWRLYALDMLGMGNSTRPPFRIRARDPKAKIAEAESWFVDALEEWRAARKIEKFTLLGHSLGGYLAVSYALKYPGRLNKLILASPVGIPEDPYAVNAALPEPEESTLQNEFTQDQESIVGNNSSNNNDNRTGGGESSSPSPSPSLSRSNTTPNTPPKRPLPSWLVWLWDANVSPFSIVRLAGPIGPRFVSRWTTRRFNHLPPEEAQAMHAYSYSLVRQKGSGEYALAYILAPGAYARDPVINRIHQVGRQIIPPSLSSSLSPSSTTKTETAPPVRETGYPVVFLYGDQDWMDVAGGFAAEEKLKQARVQALLTGSPEEKRRENGSAKVIIVRKAGHHLFLDNPEEFNDIVRKEMEETKEYNRRMRG